MALVSQWEGSQAGRQKDLARAEADTNLHAALSHVDSWAATWLEKTVA